MTGLKNRKIINRFKHSHSWYRLKALNMLIPNIYILSRVGWIFEELGQLFTIDS